MNCLCCLSRAWYTMHACKRLLEGSGHGYLAETAHVPVSAIAFSMLNAAQLPISADTRNAAQPTASGPPQSTASGALQPAAIRCAIDDDGATESGEAEPCVDNDADEEPARTSSDEEDEVIMHDIKQHRRASMIGCIADRFYKR